MKILESTPHRYDRGIRIITLGKIDRAYDRLVENIKKEDLILELGCGTGMLTFRIAEKGSSVVGIDINPQMLEICRKRLEEGNLLNKVELIEMGVAELDTFEDQKFDVVLSGLCFSELTSDELGFALKESFRLLKNEGLLVIADEVKSTSVLKRLLNLFIRIPLMIITYIFTQTTTKAISELEKQMESVGFTIVSYKSNWLENFAEIVARKS